MRLPYVAPEAKLAGLECMEVDIKQKLETVGVGYQGRCHPCSRMMMSRDFALHPR